MPPDPSKVKVQGPGIEPGNVVGKQTYFDVLTAGRLRMRGVHCLPGHGSIRANKYKTAYLQRRWWQEDSLRINHASNSKCTKKSLICLVFNFVFLSLYHFQLAAYSRPFKMRPAARIKKPLLSGKDQSSCK